jgi:choline dehydrogenase-like flavoprotein
LHGEFDQEIDAFDKAIMTAVVTEFDNLDGQGHGPKLETLLQQPFLMNHFIPWRSGAQLRQDLLRYNHLAAILVITRDKSEGVITSKKDSPLKPRVNYVVNKYDRDALRDGCVGAANLCYIEGAKRIIPPIDSVPIFETSRPKADRLLSDPEYKAWIAKLKSATVEPYHTPVGSAHQMASCRMSNKGPSHAPLNIKGQLYECQNMFVVDTSTFPTASGVNPMISCMATAHVLSSNVLDSLKRAGSPRL